MADDQLENLYDVLECEENATYDEIKRNYQRLIKQYHPDKQTNQSHDKFTKIDQAWKVLRDDELRKKYNATQYQMITNKSLIYDQLSRTDITFNDDNIFKYPCRCGNLYEITPDYMNEVEECIIECEECSNCILIKKP